MSEDQLAFQFDEDIALSWQGGLSCCTLVQCVVLKLTRLFYILLCTVRNCAVL